MCRKKDMLQIESEGTGTYTVELIKMKAAQVSGADYTVLADKTVLSHCEKNVEITLEK